MPCLLLLLVLAFPRVVMVVLFLVSNYLQRAIDNLLVLLLGFLFLPLTTLAYAWLVNSHRPLTDGVNVIILIIAVLIDVGGLGGGEWHRRSRW
jgi:hypothetical protein